MIETFGNRISIVVVFIQSNINKCNVFIVRHMTKEQKMKNKI